MSCIIKLNFSNSPEEIINRAKTAIINEGGVFNGDNSKGIFSISVAIGKVTADYTIRGQEIEIRITKKPFIFSCKRIEDFLKQQLGT